MQVVVVMLTFGLGAASMMVALGYASAGALKRLRDRMCESVAVGRTGWVGGSLCLASSLSWVRIACLRPTLSRYGPSGCQP